jgi:hypothetical protein
MTFRRRIPTDAPDDDDEWMALFRTPTDPDLDALLAGESDALADVQQLDELVGTLRAATVRHGAPPMSAALYDQIQRGQPVVDPRGRRRLVTAVAGGLLFGGTAVGIAGAQDVLPDPLQDATAAVATAFGMDLPRSTDPAPDPRGSEDPDAGADDGDPATPSDGAATDPAVPGPAVAGDPRDGAGPEGSAPTGGPPATTPSGATPATPAEPATPVDDEPATPATPATPPPETGQDPDTDRGKGEGRARATGSPTSGSAPSSAAASR